MKSGLKLVFLSFLLLFVIRGNAQFAPAVGEIGCTAIHCDSSVFVAWATDCVIERGPVQIDNPDSGYPSYGTDGVAIGKADNGVVSLGDGGIARVTFSSPIVNGSGPDFAVFENSFDDFFLELAFVEVSSDGTNFFRFPAISLTSTDSQVGTFGQVITTNIHHLAGKYRAFYGTPFDLDSLPDSYLLDKDSICYVKIIDVIGSVDPALGSYDSKGNLVNDPFPTPFYSSGFDLDAVGVIHDLSHAAIEENNSFQISMWPNPVVSKLKITLKEIPNECFYQVFNIMGMLIKSEKVCYHQFDIDFSSQPKGCYLVKINSDGLVCSRVIVK